MVLVDKENLQYPHAKKPSRLITRTLHSAQNHSKSLSTDLFENMTIATTVSFISECYNVEAFPVIENICNENIELADIVF